MTDQTIPSVARQTRPAPGQAALPISATVICRDEEACIAKCLASLEGLAEIIVVDSGSTDGTLAIVDEFVRAGFPIRLFHQPWLGYGGQKQFALDQATQPWVLSVDADEWLDDRLRAALPAMAAAEDDVAGWMVRRALTLYGRSQPISRWTRPEQILRMARRARARFDPNVIIHEGLSVEGGVRLAPSGLLRHERGLPLDVQIRKEALYARLKAEQRLAWGKKPSILKLVFNPWFYFLRIYFWNRLFLSGWAGFIHAGTGAVYSFLTESLHFQVYAHRLAEKDRGGRADLEQ
jgi:glycosyltransferase involved in cell wall biosynthesis